jgi:Methyltransferase FkbM domain
MIQTLLSELMVFDVPMQKRRLGRDFDGGYVIIDGLSYSKLYSYGIANDVSFELDFVAHAPIPAHLYDFSIEQLPAQHALFSFKKEGVRGTWKPEMAWVFSFGYALVKMVPLNTPFWKMVQRKFFGRSWKYAACKSFRQQLKSNGDLHKKDIFLKMDIEGSEYAAFKTLEDQDLTCFSQIVLEVHNLDNDKDAPMADKITFFKRLNQYFYLVHVHANNYRPIVQVDGQKIPNVMELTYLRKDLTNEVKLSETTFPTPLDRACDQNNPDLVLDFYPFRATS